MNNWIEAAQSAERILLPKSKDCRSAVVAFEETTGIEVPKFKEREYSAISLGRRFFSVSASDVPKLVGNGFGDVGVTGIDQYLEKENMYRKYIAYLRIGQPMCYLALLAPRERADLVRSRAFPERPTGYNGKLIRVATSFPNIVNNYAATNDVNIYAADGDVYSGSIEIMPGLVGCDAAVDIVSKGDTLKINGLAIVEKIMGINPILIARRGDNENI